MTKFEKKMKYLQAYDLHEGKFERPSDIDVKQFEMLIDHTLPDEYVDFLIHYGGFTPFSYTCYPTKEPDPDASEGGRSIEVFYGLFSIDDVNDLRNVFHTYKGRMPSNIIAIGCDGGSGEICLSVSGEDRGAIYFWDRDFEEDVEGKEEPGYSNLYPIAITFDEFIDLLEIWEPDEEDEIDE